MTKLGSASWQCLMILRTTCRRAARTQTTGRLGQHAAQSESPVRVVRQSATAVEPNYQALDKPTVQRKRAVGDGLDEAGLQEELLDIPAFLRRQAD